MSKIDIKTLKLTDDQKEVYNEAMISLANHNQAAIHLVTSGGKSYILAAILDTLKKQKKKRRKNLSVLYISTAGSCTNFLECMSDEYWDDVLSVINYTQLSVDEKYVDKLNKKDFDIIVLDEAHLALAEKTYKGVLYTESKYPDAAIIAMSANNRRYTGRKLVFEILTPELEVGVDYNNRGLKYAIANDKICKFNYKCCDIKRLKTYCDVFEQLRQRGLIYVDADDILNKARDIVDRYKKNAFNKLGVQIRQDLSDIGIDGSKGDRWFIFFNTIAELEESASAVQDMFETAYNSQNITVKCHHYHGKNRDVEDIEKILTGKSTPYTVDVIMTCEKGGMSFHPENTRGIIMNRKSGSEVKITQQLGRTLQIKELCSDCKLIYDLVGNNETIDITQTIFNGKQQPDERDIISWLNMSTNTDKMMESLEKEYGDTGEYSTIQDVELEDILSQFDEYKEKVENILYAKIIANLFDVYKSEHDGVMSEHPLAILRSYDKRAELDKKYGLADAFSALQKLFIQGYFGNYTMDAVPEGSDFYKIYSLLGDTLYMTSKCNADATWEDKEYEETANIKLVELQEIALKVKGYDYDYAKRISHTKDLNNKITRLRQLNLEGRLSESYQKYCMRNKIDIDGTYVNLINAVLSLPEADKFEKITKEFKAIVSKMTNIETQIACGIKVDEMRDDLLKVFAMHQIFSIRYRRHTYGNQAIIAINVRFRNIIILRNKMLSRDDVLTAQKDIMTIVRIRMCKGDASLSSRINKDYELAMMQLSIRNENGAIGEYESVVLDTLGMRFRGKYDSKIRDLIDHTPFGIAYNQLLESGSETAYNKLMEYKIENMPLYCRKLLNTKKFKQSTDEVKSNKLLVKDSKEIKQLVSNLVFPSEQDINDLKHKVETEEFDPRNLIKYAIPEKVYLSNKKFLDRAITEQWGSIENNVQNIILSIIKKNTMCTGDIVECLYTNKLIPEIQMEFADNVIKVTQ